MKLPGWTGVGRAATDSTSQREAHHLMRHTTLRGYSTRGDAPVLARFAAASWSAAALHRVAGLEERRVSGLQLGSFLRHGIGRTTVFWSARGRAQRRRRFGCAWRCKSPWHSWRQTHSFPIRISLTLRYFLRRVGMMRQLVAYPVLWGFFGRNQPGEGEFIMCAVPGAVRVNSVSQGFANTTRATCPASPYFAFWFTGLSKTMCSGKLAACTPPRLSRRLFCEPPLGWFNGINIPPCSSSIP